jgi:hypothetical protein
VIKTLDAQTGQFLLGCNCPVSRFLPGWAKDLSAPHVSMVAVYLKFWDSVLRPTNAGETWEFVVKRKEGTLLIGFVITNLLRVVYSLKTSGN